MGNNLSLILSWFRYSCIGSRCSGQAGDFLPKPVLQKLFWAVILQSSVLFAWCVEGIGIIALRACWRKTKNWYLRSSLPLRNHKFFLHMLIFLVTYYLLFKFSDHSWALHFIHFKMVEFILCCFMQHDQ